VYCTCKRWRCIFNYQNFKGCCFEKISIPHNIFTIFVGYVLNQKILVGQIINRDCGEFSGINPRTNQPTIIIQGNVIIIPSGNHNRVPTSKLMNHTINMHYYYVFKTTNIKNRKTRFYLVEVSRRVRCHWVGH